MLKKLFTTTILFSLLSIIITPVSFGIVDQPLPVVESPQTVIPIPQGSSLPVPSEPTTAYILGQDHYYTVTFRGNGEAVVALKIIFSNFETTSLSKLTFNIPKVTPKDLVVYQVLREPQCIEYIESQSQPIQYIPGSNTATPTFRSPCLGYQEPDYYQYLQGGTTYKKAQHALTGNKLTVTLPQETKAESSGSIIIYYRTTGYVTREFGAFRYIFETIKAEDSIRTLQIGVTIDPDFIFSGVSGFVSYRSPLQVPPMKIAETTTRSQSARFDTFYQQIGQGAFVKNASNLQSHESYTIKGKYAKNIFLLYLKEIIIGLGILFAIGVVAFLIIRRILKQPTPNTSRKLANPQSQFARRLLETEGASFIGSILMLAYSLLLSFEFIFLGRYGVVEQFFILVFIFTVVVSMGIYGVLFIFPAYFIGKRQGIKWGVITFVSTIGWVILYLLILLTFLFLTHSRNQGYSLY